MKNTFHKAIAATALLALGFAAAPAFADAAADKITSYVEIARSVFGGDKTSGDVVSATLAAAADKGVDAQGTVGELAAALSAAEVAKADPADVGALADIVSAVNDAAGDDAFDFASRAAATVAAVTGLDVAGSLADEAFADAANDPDSVLDATEKAGLKDLYEKVLAALKGNDYTMKEDGDKVSVGGKGKKGKKGKGKDGSAAAAAAAAGAGAAAADGSSSDADGDGKSGGSGDTVGGGKSGGSGDTTGGGSDGGKDEDVVYDDDENLGDPVDQTFDPVTPPVDPDDSTAPYGPHEYRPTSTTMSGLGPALVPVVTPTTTTTKTSTTTKPKTTKPSPTPVGLR